MLLCTIFCELVWLFLHEAMTVLLNAEALKVRDGVLPARVFVMGRLQDGFFFFFLSTLSVPCLTL